MNRIYRLVWSAAAQWVPAWEFARSAQGGRARTSLRAACVLGSVLSFAGLGLVRAAPQGSQITTGSGQVTQTGKITTVQQNSQNLALNWQSFNVGANETVNFVQPSASAIAVNRVLGNSGSEILGHVNANGQVWLINPNGILFGKGSQVNVGGLVATTLDSDAANFSAAAKTFGGSGSGSVINQGTINAASGGYVALLGNSVSNEGVISAQLGTIALGAGSAATLTFSHNRLLQVQVDDSTLNNLAANSGLAAADGGTVLMTAGAKNSLLASSVNNTGVIRANSVENHNGTIVLVAGDQAGQVNVGGSVQAASTDGSGGTVIATATGVSVLSGAHIDVTGGSGGGTIDIGGGWQGAAGIAEATTVTVAPSATLNASAGKSGNGGEIVVRSAVDNPNSRTRAYGTFAATGGIVGGAGGRIETSGYWLDVAGSSVNTSAAKGPAGLWLLDPQNVTIALGGTAVGAGTYVPVATSTISAGSIATALQGGSNVTITTGTTGGSLGDITVASPITKASGNADVTLTLQAADSIIINSPISNTGGTGKLNLNLYADNSNGAHDGVGVVILNNNISTGGGAVAFGNGATATINGVANTLVGGDVYVGGSSAINLTTSGGNVAFNGQLIIANTAGFNIDTTVGATGGNVLFAGLVDSGDSYALNNTSLTWNAAQIAAKSGVGAGVGDTYLATVTSRLENAVASYTAGYTASWLGGERLVSIGTDAVWRWVAGPEGLANGGLGATFFTQNGSNVANGSGGAAIGGAYQNWNSGEPNNYQGANLTAAGRNEWVMQFVGTQGQWNDLPGNSSVLPYVVETNVSSSPLNVTSGPTNTVTFAGGLGTHKPLYTLAVTGQIILLNNASTTIDTTGPTTFNGQVQLNGTNVDVLTITAPSLTTTYGATLPGSFTPTYSGFLHGDTSASLTTLPTVATTGTTTAVSTAPITASGAVDPNYLILYDPGTLVVNPAPLTVSGTSIATKTYNGLFNATLSGGALSGVFNADLANVTLTQAGTFVSKNAGSTVGVTVADTLSGTAAIDYVLQQPTGLTGTIIPLGLTLTGTTVTNKVYNGTNAAALLGGSLVGVLAGDVGSVTLGQSGTFSSASVGTGLSVTATDSLSGSAAVNYTVTQPTGLTGSITALGLTVSGSTVSSKTYDGTFSAPVSGGSLVGVLAGDLSTVTLGQSGTFASKGVGTTIGVTATDTLGGSAAGNYLLQEPIGLTASINPLGITVSGSSVGTKVYDGTGAATLTGGSLVGVLTGDLLAIGLSQSGMFVSLNAGATIAVNTSDALTGSTASNYSLIQPTGLSGSITPAHVTLAGAPITATKIYDGTTAASTSGGSLSGLIAGDSSAVSLVTNFASANAGQNIAVIPSLSGANASNYIIDFTTGALRGNINPAPLLATADDRGLAVGGTLPPLSGTFTGFVGQNYASLLASGYHGTWTSTAGSGSAAGSYAIVGAFDDANYNVIQAASNATALTAAVPAPSNAPSASSLLSTTVNGSGATSGNTFGNGVGQGTTLVASNTSVGIANGANDLSSGVGNTVSLAQQIVATDGGGAANGFSGASSSGAALGGNTVATNDNNAAFAANTSSAGTITSASGGVAANAGNIDATTTLLGGRRLIVLGGGVNNNVSADSAAPATH
jgi:filamentous hemagglutinin family protein